MKLKLPSTLNMRWIQVISFFQNEFKKIVLVYNDYNVR